MSGIWERRVPGQPVPYTISLVETAVMVLHSEHDSVVDGCVRVLRDVILTTPFLTHSPWLKRLRCCHILSMILQETSKCCETRDSN